MQIILLENLRKLGRLGETVKVKDGFARNFLIPNKKALRATEANKTLFEARRAEIEKENAKKHEAAEKISGHIEGKVIPLIRQAGEDGRLYGSVTASDVAKAASTKTNTVEKKHILLDKPIKTVGIFPVRVNMHGDLEITININVARSDAEAKDASNKFAKGEYVNPFEAGAKKSYEDLIAEAEPVEAEAAEAEATEEQVA